MERESDLVLFPGRRRQPSLESFFGVINFGKKERSRSGSSKMSSLAMEASMNRRD